MSETGEGRPAPANRPRDTPKYTEQYCALLEDAYRVHQLVCALEILIEFAGENPPGRMKAINAAEAILEPLAARSKALPERIEQAFDGRAA